MLNTAPVALDDSYVTDEDTRLVVAGLNAGWVREVSGSNPLNWWRFEELDGTIAPDQGSAKNDGTYLGGVTLGESGLTGNAARFDGTGAVIISQNSLGTDWTVESIFSTDVDTGGPAQGLLGALSHSPDWMAIQAEQYPSTGLLGYTRFTVANYRFSANAPLELTHVVMVGTASGVALYVDGVFVQREPTPTILSRHVIGAGHEDGTGNLFDTMTGVIDELVIYNRALTKDEITKHFDAIGLKGEGPQAGGGGPGAGVLANDIDADGDTLTAVLVTPAPNGRVELRSDGTFRYMPNPDFSGTDRFTYRATDGTLQSNVATVTITVNAVDDPPVAVAVALDDSYVTNEDTRLVVAGLNAGWVREVSGSNPLNWWRFEELDKTVARDQGSAKNDGTYLGGVTLGEAGLTGNAARFDGTGGVIVNQNSLGTNWTVESIFSTDVERGGQSQGLLGARSNSPDWMAIQAEQYPSTGLLGYTQFTVANYRFSAKAPSELAHVVMVGTASGVQLYVDGEFVQREPTPTILSRHVIGAGHEDGAGNLFDTMTGVIDELVIYNRALTKDQVTKHFDVIGLTGEASHVGVLANDIDADGDTLTAVLVTPASNGRVELRRDGTFRYMPNPDFSGTDRFTYRATDGTLQSNVATVTITVNIVDDPPVAVADRAYRVADDITLNVAAPDGVLRNDTDLDSPMLTAALVDPPARGTVTLRPDGSFTYTPNSNFFVSDTFTYRASDGTSQSEVATVLIRAVRTTGDQTSPLPVAADDRFSVAEDRTLSLDASPLLSVLTVPLAAEDLGYDPAGDTVYTTIPAGARNRANTLTPIDPYSGQLGESITIGIRPSAMVISDNGEIIHAVVEDGHAVQVYDVLNKRLGPKFWMSQTEPANVSVNSIQAVSGRADAVVLTRRFVHVSPSTAGSGIYVQGVLLPDNIPAGGPDILAVNETGDRVYGYQNSLSSYDFWSFEAYDRGMRELDYYPWGRVLKGNVDNMAVAGNHLFVSGGGVVDLRTLQQVATFEGGENFVVAAHENALYSIDNNAHTLHVYDLTTLQRKASVDLPGFVPAVRSLIRFGADGLAFRTNDGRVVFVRSDALLGLTKRGELRNDRGPADATVRAILVDDVDHGVLQLNGDGTFHYRPNENFVGVDSFRYKLNDGRIDSNISTVTITVRPVNDPPLAADVRYVLPASVPLVVGSARGVLANVSYPIERDPLVAVVQQGPSHGTLSLNSDGSFRYVPSATFVLADRFTYRANDGSDDSNLATVTIRLDVPSIEVGDHVLQANTPGQTIDVLVTGGHTVAGVDLFVQVGDGGPELTQLGLPAGTDGPAITGVDLKQGAIFAAVPDNATDLSSLPQVANWSISVTEGGDVRANGKLATLTFDTTGLFAGRWDLRLAELLPAHPFGPFNTGFAGIPAYVVNGTVSVVPARVVSRHVFYNNSKWDENSPAAGPADDTAIAPNKTALLPGQRASFANYTSYSKGINGIIADIQGLSDPIGISLEDFQFRVGRNNDPSTWTIQPGRDYRCLRFQS